MKYSVLLIFFFAVFGFFNYLYLKYKKFFTDKKNSCFLLKNKISQEIKPASKKI